MSDYIKLSTSDVPTFSEDEKNYPDWVRSQIIALIESE